MPAQANLPSHPYLGHSAECWDVYTRAIAREYQEYALYDIHQLTVDAYACQHPGDPGRRQRQSVWLHLATLYLFLVKDQNPQHGSRLHKILIEKAMPSQWITPPDELKRIMTIADVAKAASPEEYRKLVHEWALQVWHAWQVQAGPVILWAEEALKG